MSPSLRRWVRWTSVINLAGLFLPPFYGAFLLVFLMCPPTLIIPLPMLWAAVRPPKSPAWAKFLLVWNAVWGVLLYFSWLKAFFQYGFNQVPVRM
jgi:hypothetical protein